MSTVVYPDSAEAASAIGDLIAELIVRRRTFHVEPRELEWYGDDEPDTRVSVTLTGYVDPSDVAYLMDWARGGNGEGRIGFDIRFPGRKGEPVSVSIRFRSS